MELTGEAKNIEYKQEYSKTILKTVCAYANFHDGYIVLGVKDDCSVVGVDKIGELKLSIENAINDSIIPSPYYEFEVKQMDKNQILLIKVYKGWIVNTFLYNFYSVILAKRYSTGDI